MVKDIEILVVEDEKLNAELLTQLLEALKYKVHWVDNGKAALNKAKNEKPDLILLDIILPGISGYEVCKKINNHPITKDIPIIFISSLDSAKDIAKGLKIGADDYIIKPFNKKLVQSRIENQLTLSRAKQELKFENNQQDILLENIDTQVWYLKDKYTYGKVNSSHAEFMGYNKVNMENKRLSELLKEKSTKICYKSNKKVFENKEKVISEEWTTNYKGEKRLLRITKNPVFNDKGDIEYVVSSAEDITEQKKQQEELKKTKDLLEKLADQAPGALYQYRFYPKNEASYFTYASDGIYEIFAVEPKEVMADASNAFDKIHPDDYDNVIESIKKSAAELKAWKEIFRVNHPEKGVIWIEGHSKPEVMDDGSVLWHGNIRDITEEKKQEFKLKKSKEKFKSYFENSPTAIFITDENGYYKNVNESASKMLGYDRDELIGKHLLEIHPPSTREKIKNAFLHLKKEGYYKNNLKMLTKNNEIKFVRLNTVRLSSQDFLGYVEDLTKIKKTNTELKITSKKLESMFNNIQSPVFLIDINNGSYTYEKINLNYEKFIEKSSDSIKGKNPKDLFGNKVGREIINNYKKCYASKQTITYEETTILNGKKRFWLTKLSPIEIEGKIEKLVGTSVDITDNKIRANKIEKQNNKLEKILETAMDGFIIVDSEGNIKNGNKSFMDMLSYDEKELSNIKIQDIEAKETSDEVRNHINLIKSNGSDRFETILIGKDEKLINAEISVTYLGMKNDLFFAFVRDITKRKKRQKEINEIKERLELAVEGGNIGIWEWNIKTGEAYYDKSSANMLGYKEGEIDYHISSWKNIIHEDDLDNSKSRIRNIIEGITNEFETTIRLKTKAGDWKWVKHVGKISEKDENENPLRVVGVHIDIDNEIKTREKIEYLSFHDSLTGLYNYRYFNEEIKRVSGSRYYPITLVVGDLDNLKIINDNYGHQVGDEYLQKVADILKNTFRNEDVISRIGGDEFAVILPNTSKSEVNRIINRVREKIKITKNNNDRFDLLDISLGCYTTENSSTSFSNAYKIADQRMYKEKKKKRNEKKKI